MFISLWECTFLLTVERRLGEDRELSPAAKLRYLAVGIWYLGRSLTISFEPLASSLRLTCGTVNDVVNLDSNGEGGADAWVTQAKPWVTQRKLGVTQGSKTANRLCFLQKCKKIGGTPSKVYWEVTKSSKLAIGQTLREIAVIAVIARNRTESERQKTK